MHAFGIQLRDQLTQFFRLCISVYRPHPQIVFNGNVSCNACERFPSIGNKIF